MAARRRRIRRVAALLQQAYPRSTCALNYATPFQLLVATVLSAQTTDTAVNAATKSLFAAFPDAAAMAAAPPGAIEAHIRSIGLWQKKAKYIRELSRRLCDEFGGELPRTVAELTRLPGVAKKTATATLGQAFGIAAGITVDTHMLRLHRLLQLSPATTADALARDLESLLPRTQWVSYTHRVIDHGRWVCVARRPRCGVCVLAALCPSARQPAVGYRPDNDRVLPASAKGLSWLQHSADPEAELRALAAAQGAAYPDFTRRKRPGLRQKQERGADHGTGQ